MDFEPEWTNSEETTSFRRIPPLLKRDIDAFARERNYPIGLAARVLLTFSLREYQQGELKLYPQMTQRGWSLYPETLTTGTSKIRYRTVTFRGVPSSITDEIEKISEAILVGTLQIKVDKGDVARAFFEHGLENYRKSLRNKK